MTRGRKALPTAENKAIPINEDALRQDIATADTFSALQEGYEGDRDLANLLLGQVQAFHSIAKFTTVVGLTKLQYVKEHKLYQSLKGKKLFDPDGKESRLSGTWAEYCGLLGTSANKVDEDLLNLRIFGEEAMQQLSSVGAGYRDLRKLRALPDETRKELLVAPELQRAIAEGDKDAVRELVEDMAVTNREKLEELASTIDAKDRVLEAKAKRNETLEVELQKAKRRVKTQQPDDTLAQIRLELLGFAAEAEGVIVNSLHAAFKTLAEHVAEHGGKADEIVDGCLRQIEQRIADIRDEFQIVGKDGPEWAKS